MNKYLRNFLVFTMGYGLFKTFNLGIIMGIYNGVIFGILGIGIFSIGLPILTRLFEKIEEYFESKEKMHRYIETFLFLSIWYGLYKAFEEGVFVGVYSGIIFGILGSIMFTKSFEQMESIFKNNRN
ncbi:hypothetical protein Halha_1951 [Halobacteroides halobius DSM 5150]|uniref:Uncharacterized protein n=1 Tax=Halobacteroides halobius (strain ATCC 35273 / DSM 5150 / MD-1) TaxID=748449 RepID=L0KCR0_HALHC|nr:hypothetical protein [Halobacteroides halobius]AGB41858.1 hypothetical protein Halha_1951 [Halobacteroides halobius DSM 5150]